MKNITELIFLWLIVWGIYFNTPVYLIIHPPFIVSFLQERKLNIIDNDILLYNISKNNNFFNYDSVLVFFMKNETYSNCKKCVSNDLIANNILNEKYKKNDLIYEKYSQYFSQNEDVKKIQKKQNDFYELYSKLNKQYAETKIIDKELEKKVAELDEQLEFDIKKYNESLINKWEKFLNENK